MTDPTPSPLNGDGLPFDSPYLYEQEAAMYLRQEQKTVNRWHRDGKIPAVKTRAGLIYTISDLDLFMSKRFDEARRRLR